MSIKRFVAPTGREALAQVRRELGENALVLSTRRLTGGRMEVLAVGPDDMQALIEDSRGTRAAPAKAAADAAAATPARPAERGARVHPPASGVRAESFHDYLQRQRIQAADTRATEAASLERSVSRHYEELAGAAAADEPAPAPVQEPSVFRRRTGEAAAAMAMPPPAVRAPVEPMAAAAETTAASPAASASNELRPAVPAQPASMPAPPATPTSAAADARLLAEMQTMRALLLEQMATMGAARSAAELHRRSPMQVRAMTRLLTAGFSPEVARQIAERAPAAATPADSDRWLADVLALNVRCADAEADWLGRGGVFALVGPTGVGKTTTVAKLAARFAVRHGTQALGLITLDAFRVGAHEQLRAYGRILGTPVHLAQDMITLRELLAAMAGRKLVLIDTCGVSQRDERLNDMLAMLEQAAAGQRPVQRLLLLNAASHAETLDDVARAWRARECAGAVLTKLDEAVRLGGALDCVLRHKLEVLGATNGQRVPEDWLAVDSRQLAVTALKPGQSPFTLAESEGAVLGVTAPRAGLALAH
jgi:flagellar biosynthesis protein FlhF